MSNFKCCIDETTIREEQQAIPSEIIIGTRYKQEIL